jgi:Domain of unknown function (DUF3883)
MKKPSLREKSIISGLYLSKFNLDGLRRLDFESFTEAFNVIGFALGVQPASIKNYRDEFDPLYPNNRKGWHRRAIRAYCKVIYDRFGALGIDEFSTFLKKVVYRDHELDLLAENVARGGDEASSFARRLITGQAAEHYFTQKFQEIEFFKGLKLEDTTRIGCGFDFRLVSPRNFYAIEVKGMNEPGGNISMTEKEYSVASVLREQYFLFIVKNFRDKPIHQLFQDPVNCGLAFKKVEQKIVQLSWSTKL